MKGLAKTLDSFIEESEFKYGKNVFNLLIGGKDIHLESINTSDNYIEIVHSLNALDENSILIRSKTIRN